MQGENRLTKTGLESDTGTTRHGRVFVTTVRAIVGQFTSKSSGCNSLTKTFVGEDVKERVPRVDKGGQLHDKVKSMCLRHI